MTWIDALYRDLRHAGRMIARMPVLAIVVVLSLGVGIGANLVIFSWIQAVVLKPIPGVARAASFYLVEPRTETGTNPGMSWLEYRDLRERLPAFPNLLAFRMSPLYVGEPGQVERAYGLLVSANYFSGLGLQPALGRFFLADEVSQPGGAPVVVIRTSTGRASSRERQLLSGERFASTAGTSRSSASARADSRARYFA